MHTREATLEDLAREPGKAELVNGRIVRMSPTGGLPGTPVVWDVDLLGADVLRVYRSHERERPTVYRHGDVAEAENGRARLVDVRGRPLPPRYHFSYCTARRS